MQPVWYTRLISPLPHYDSSQLSSYLFNYLLIPHTHTWEAIQLSFLFISAISNWIRRCSWPSGECQVVVCALALAERESLLNIIHHPRRRQPVNNFSLILDNLWCLERHVLSAIGFFPNCARETMDPSKAASSNVTGMEMETEIPRPRSSNLLLTPA